jgi:hypothetical protein
MGMVKMLEIVLATHPDPLTVHRQPKSFFLGLTLLDRRLN